MSLIFKNSAPFISFISNINNVLINNVEDLDIVTATYNLVEYSSNYWKTTSSLWNYRYELSDDSNDNDSPNKNVITSRPFKYKTSITEISIDYNVAEKMTNEDGNEIHNAAYDANKIVTKEV